MSAHVPAIPDPAVSPSPRDGSPSKPSLLLRMGVGLQALLGTISLVGWLSALASLPLLNLLALGYLMESSARLSRSGRWRDGFPGVRKALFLTLLLSLGWLVLSPSRVAAGFWRDAQLLGDGGAAAERMEGILLFLSGGAALLLAGTAVFLWKRKGVDFGEMLIRLRLPFLFWLGLRGLFGGVMWLVLPVGLMWCGTQIPGDQGGVRGLFGFLGGALLVVSVCLLPFLQMEFAESRRFSSFWRVRSVIRRIHRAPLACALALMVLTILSLPLSLLKLEKPPQELGWFLAIFFVLAAWPSRLVLGWAWHRTTLRDEARERGWIWIGRFGAGTFAVVYALFLWLSQYLVWEGAAGMLEQHAFLLPTPFWSWD
ncbi:MAG: hypothetical protein AAF191_02145 [Verrucomicrobiota bacterium]